MKLEDLVKLGEIDAIGAQTRQRFVKSPYFNIPLALAQAEGKENEPGLQHVIQSHEGMAPELQKPYLDAYVDGASNALYNGVSSNIPIAIRGLSDKRVLADYLLGTAKPGKFGGVSDDFAKAYAVAHSARKKLENEAELPMRAREYVEDQLEDLKKRKVSDASLNALRGYYQNTDAAIDALKMDVNIKTSKFLDVLKVSDGQKYVKEYFTSLKPDEKNTEAYRLGQAVFQNFLMTEAEKKAKKKKK